MTDREEMAVDGMLLMINHLRSQLAEAADSLEFLLKDSKMTEMHECADPSKCKWMKAHDTLRRIKEQK